MIKNSFLPQYNFRNKTINFFGKDNTGKTVYQINAQGFRSSINYVSSPQYAFFGSSTIFGVGVNEPDLLVNYFPHSQNYGLAGGYLNQHSVDNLKHFLNSKLYTPQVKIVFFWIDRPGKEHIPDLVSIVNGLKIGILHISQGAKYSDCINLPPSIDTDVSGTQAGPRTHRVWAKMIKVCLKS